MKSVVFNLFLWVTKDHMQTFNPKQLKVGAMVVAPLRVILFTILSQPWVFPFWPEWNASFHSNRNGMSHSIPDRVKCFIPAGMEWPIPFRPEWNAIPWLGLRNMQPGGFHFGQAQYMAGKQV